MFIFGPIVLKYHKSKSVTKLPKYQIGNRFVKTKNVNNLKKILVMKCRFAHLIKI